MLTKNHAQEGLSRAYIHALTAAARVHLKMDQEFDYGFDGSFDSIEENEYLERGKVKIDYIKAGFPIEFQLKCSSEWKIDGEDVVWSIKTRAFNKLARRSTDAVPAILILMCLPKLEQDWVVADEHSLLLKKCCFYTTIIGPPFENNKSSKQLRIPRSNLLSPDSLASMLNARRQGVETTEFE